MLTETEAAELCRQLPQLGQFLASEEASELLREWPRELVVEAGRAALGRIRERARMGALTQDSFRAEVNGLASGIADELRAMTRPSLRRVINATGVILQTNLGRAPLSEAAIRRIEEIARGYCNLEFDLETGGRGRRDSLVEELILRVLELRSGPEAVRDRAATVVNNCAAATFLALNSLAEGGEVLVSRGELVEIGGGFRIPEILRKSGAILREVGTTNRTRISDYAAAIGPQTRLILRVHRSNFKIEGFAEQPSLQELIGLGAETGIPVFEDQGTGCIVQLEDFGMRDEVNWVRDAACRPALISASGDKLMGGPQCGILVGEGKLVEAIRANPLARAFRADKLTYAALEATLLAYAMGEEETIPAIAMMRRVAEGLRVRCDVIAERLRAAGFEAEVIATRSVVGGGTTPGASLPSFGVALRLDGMSEDALEAKLRGLDPPVIARIAQERVVLDLRTVADEDDATLCEMLLKLRN